MVHHLLDDGASLMGSYTKRAVIWNSRSRNAMVNRIRLKKDHGIPGTLSGYIDHILATHEMVEESAGKFGLPMYWPAR